MRPTRRRDGGTGRREGLKNLWAQAHGGSIPPPGTISNQILVATWNTSVEDPDAKLCQNCANGFARTYP